MSLNLYLNYRSYIGLILSLSILCTLVSPYIFIFSIAFISFILLYFFKSELLLPISVILFLVLTGQELENYRSIVNISVILLLAVIFLKKFGLNFQGYPKVPSQVVFFVSYLTFTLFISSSLSIDPVSAYLTSLRLLVFFLVCYFYYALIQNASTIDKYLIAILISVLIIGISVLIDVAKNGFVFFLVEGLIIRQGGIYGNPNYLGLLLSITIPINVAFFFRKFRHSFTIKFGLLAILLLSIFLLFISNSRASIFGTILASSITIAFINRKIFFRFISILVCSSIILLLFNELQDYLAVYFRLERVGNREYFWNVGLDIFSDHPYFGVGPELFGRYFFSYMPSVVKSLYDSSVWSVGTPHPHNFFLLFIAENGILGFLCAVFFFILFFYFSFKTIKLTKNKNTNDYLIGVAAIGIGVGILFRAFFEVTGIITYGFITRDLPLWILFVIIIHIFRKNLC